MFGNKSVQPAEPAFQPLLREDRRRAVRHTTVFQVAKLCTGRTQELCILRDISDTGLRAEVYCAVSIGAWLTFEMRTGHTIAGRVVWRRDASIGVEFDQSISVPEVLAHCSFDDRLARMRPPRIDVQMPALLMVERRLLDVTIRNISQAGMKISVDETLESGDTVTVRMDGIGQRSATVRWVGGDAAGLQLAQPLTYPEFAAWRIQALCRG